MANIQYLEVSYFENEAFLKDNTDFVDLYAALRVKGVHSQAAFRRVFGSVNCDSGLTARIQTLEASDLYNDLFDAKLKTLPLDDILSSRKALHTYLEIASDPNVKESSRVAALKEAAVLAGLTVIDNEGRSQRIRTLDQFYATVDAMRAGGANPDSEGATKH